MAQSNNLNPNDYLTEDPMVLPFGKMVKVLRGQVPLPFAVVLAAILKITKLLGGGSALNAGARESHPVEYPQIPSLGKKAFESAHTQLVDFDFVAFAKRDIVGMRQDYSALALHRGQKCVAICQWQQHLIVLPADKMADERDKSMESLSIEFVSFEGDRPIVTSSVPREHMGAADLYDPSLGDIAIRSNETRLEEIFAEHLSRIQDKAIDTLTPESAIIRAKEYGHRVRDSFINLGLLRPITEKELQKILAEQEKHKDRFAKYTTLNPSPLD